MQKKRLCNSSYTSLPPPSTKLDNSAAYCYVIGGAEKTKFRRNICQRQVKRNIWELESRKTFRNEVKENISRQGLEDTRPKQGLEDTKAPAG